MYTLVMYHHERGKRYVRLTQMQSDTSMMYEFTEFKDMAMRRKKEAAEAVLDNIQKQQHPRRNLKVSPDVDKHRHSLVIVEI